MRNTLQMLLFIQFLFFSVFVFYLNMYFLFKKKMKKNKWIKVNQPERTTLFLDDVDFRFFFLSIWEQVETGKQ